jgi:hypothetical protein
MKGNQSTSRPHRTATWHFLLRNLQQTQCL